jgi:menaquinone-dependent protoporphyrinogen IX oxidase
LRGWLLTKVFVIYDTRYGNTKLVAENILEGMKEAEGIETTIGYVKEVNPAKLADYDAILIGAPNHMGKPSRTISKFVDELAKLDLKAKQVAVFDTYFGRPRNLEKAMKKLEKQISQKLPSWKLITSGLSIKVTGVNGPIAEGELPKCVDFGTKIAEQLKSL